jgi:large subunit ribosomal protein L25
MAATLNAVKRDSRGKNEARRLRAAGQIPGVVYGGVSGEGAVAIAVEPKALSRILHSESGVNTLIDLSVDGTSSGMVLVKEFQLDPIKKHLLHADFYRLAMDKPITITVQVQLTGESKGVKQQSGVLEFLNREVEIEVLPTNIPEQLVVDVSELVIGQGVRVRDLAKDALWTPLTDPDVMLVHVTAPRAVDEPAVAGAEPAAATGGAEPEVIKKGKPEKAE